MTPRQCKAARVWVGWTQYELARKVGVYRQKVAALESGADIEAETKVALEAALVNAGVTITKQGSIILSA